jgi:hypothetical protein
MVVPVMSRTDRNNRAGRFHAATLCGLQKHTVRTVRQVGQVRASDTMPNHISGPRVSRPSHASLRPAVGITWREMHRQT